MIDNIQHIHQDIYGEKKWRAWAAKVDSFTPEKDPEFGRDLGLGHWFEMSNIASNIVSDLGGTEREIILADIAGLLCGCALVDGFQDYAKRSGDIAYDYLTGRYYNTALNGLDIDMICHAISIHDTGEDIQNVIDAALCIADKVDIGNSRIKKPVTPIQKAISKIGHANYFVAEGENGMISINYDGSGDFKPFEFMGLWPAARDIPHKAAIAMGRPFAIFLDESTLLWKPDAVITDDDGSI